MKKLITMGIVFGVGAFVGYLFGVKKGYKLSEEELHEAFEEVKRDYPAEEKEETPEIPEPEESKEPEVKEAPEETPAAEIVYDHETLMNTPENKYLYEIDKYAFGEVDKYQPKEFLMYRDGTVVDLDDYDSPLQPYQVALYFGDYASRVARREEIYLRSEVYHKDFHIEFMDEDYNAEDV